MTREILETLERQTGDAPVASIVMLHGLGADGSDFLPFVKELDLSSVGPVRFIFPSAPVQPVSINNGMRMRSWYDIRHTTDLSRREDEGGLRASRLDIQALLDREAERGVPPSRTVLMGFSQGCAMALLTGLRAPQRLAGLAGMSGYLPLLPTTAAERSAANADVPIFLAHGRFDGVVPMARGMASRDMLTELGHEVEWHEYPMDHEVRAAEVADLNAWLLKVLASH